MTRHPLFRRGTLSACVLALIGALAGCATPRNPGAAAPDQVLQQAAVPAQLPVGAGAAADTPVLDWQTVVLEPRLRHWVAQALAHNRDLRVAALNVQRAQAQLGLADANRLPTVGAAFNASRAPNSQGNQASSLAAGLQITAWEIDVFGRLANLSEAAKAQLAASQAGQRATALTVTAAVVQVALALQADDELLTLARQTLASREQSLKLVQLRESAGASSLLDLQAQLTLAAQARATLAQLTRQQAQDASALALLLGQPAPPATASAEGGTRLADEAWLAEAKLLVVRIHMLSVRGRSTGFDRAEKKREDSRCIPIQKEAHDIPTIIRNRWEQERFAKVRPPTAEQLAIDPGAEDRYDIPAFLRRKAE